MAENHFWVSTEPRPSPSGEFSSSITEPFTPEELSDPSRRRFLAMAAASAAFAHAGCTTYRDVGKIIPYSKKPVEVTEGIATYYASTCSCGHGCGVLVKTREGRPIKILGNPDHPVSRGGICVQGQASLHALYDPDRLKSPRKGGSPIAWDDVDREVRALLQAASRSRKEIAIITRPVRSPFTANVLKSFAEAFPSTRVYSYDPLQSTREYEAANLAYQVSTVGVPKLDKARVILSVGHDFLGTDGDVVSQTRRYTQTRSVDSVDRFSRLYVAESTLTVTGANSDARFRLKPSELRAFLYAVTRELVVKRRLKSDRVTEAMASQLAPPSPISFPEPFDRLIEDLVKERSGALVLVGPEQPVELQVMGHFLNDLLNGSALLDFDHPKMLSAPLAAPGFLPELMQSIEANRVGVVIHLDVNPLFDLGASAYGSLVSKVASLALSTHTNETLEACLYQLPIHHPAERWGDSECHQGIRSVAQPVIEPLYSTRAPEGALLQWAKATDGAYSETDCYTALRAQWETEYRRLKSALSFEQFWNALLHDGVVVFPTVSRGTRSVSTAAVNSALTKMQTAIPSEWELELRPHHAIRSHDLCNVGWLHELPHPVSKITWDNYAALSQASATELGVSCGDRIAVSANGETVDLPVWILPGQADRTITVESGLGRRSIGEVGRDVGTDVNRFLKGHTATQFSEIAVTRREGRHPLASTQEHYSIESPKLKSIPFKRHIVQEGTVAQYLSDPKFLEHGRHHTLVNITKPHSYPGVKWGMSIDLNRCTGCNACVMSCNVENNIPVVGKDQVLKSREMAWLRIDRYFSGPVESPQVSYQPMLCQHCDNAPCENVCPVAATTHSPDGRNEMTYNRCVGTRYCSNNCPYKVRRFNFFDFRHHFRNGHQYETPLDLLSNPNVTVRSRGVMEKCSFCVQRVMEASQNAKVEGRPLKGSDVKTACQEVCPAEAIQFGDVNDPNSEVSKARKHPLGYHVLEELNVKPNVTYIAKLRNGGAPDEHGH